MREFDKFKAEFDQFRVKTIQSLTTCDKNLESLEVQNDYKLDGLRVQTLEVLNKKADYSLLERLKETLAQKADFDHV